MPSSSPRRVNSMSSSPLHFRAVAMLRCARNDAPAGTGNRVPHSRACLGCLRFGTRYPIPNRTRSCRFAAKQAGKAANRTASMAHQEPPERSDAVDHSETEVANQPQRRAVVGKEPVQRIRCRGKREGIEASPLLVAPEHVNSAKVEPQPRCIEHHFGQRRDVLETEIESLPGNGMNPMRGVTHERKAGPHVFACKM